MMKGRIKAEQTKIKLRLKRFFNDNPNGNTKNSKAQWIGNWDTNTKSYIQNTMPDKNNSIFIEK